MLLVLTPIKQPTFVAFSEEYRGHGSSSSDLFLERMALIGFLPTVQRFLADYALHLIMLFGVHLSENFPPSFLRETRKIHFFRSIKQAYIGVSM